MASTTRSSAGTVSACGTEGALSCSPFMEFTWPDGEQFYPKWGPGENEFVKTPEGEIDWWHFTRPFRCIVRQKQYGDVIWCGHYPVLISNRLLEIFRSAQVNGFEVLPAEVRLMFPHDPKDAIFWQLTVNGWGGVARPESGIHRVVDPKKPASLEYSACSDPSAIIDPSQWDGSDFFFVWPLVNYWWITPRVVDILSRHKMKRFKLRRPDELTFSESSDAKVGFRAKRLRHYLPEPRASEIGKPLGIY